MGTDAGRLQTRFNLSMKLRNIKKTTATWIFFTICLKAVAGFVKGFNDIAV